MSGHSKWHKTKHRKAQVEGKKSKLFTRLSREIKVAARAGNNPATNASLRDAIERAKKANVPQANIDRLLHRDLSKTQEIIYEGYGVHGVALLIICATENPNRTVAELRSILKDHSGSLGTPNSVRWKFTRHGTLFATLPAHEQTLTPAESEALEALIGDLVAADDVIDVYTTARTEG